MGLGNFEQVGKPDTAQALALEVSNLAAFRASLAAKGYESTEPRNFPTCSISVVRDPVGNDPDETTNDRWDDDQGEYGRIYLAMGDGHLVELITP